MDPNSSNVSINVPIVTETEEKKCDPKKFDLYTHLIPALIAFFSNLVFLICLHLVLYVVESSISAQPLLVPELCPFLTHSRCLDGFLASFC